MKYIAMLNAETNKKEIFTFPSTVNHDVMANSCIGLKDRAHGNWNRIHRSAVSAGFVDSKGQCYGLSETLGLESMAEDTEILAKQMAEYHGGY